MSKEKPEAQIALIITKATEKYGPTDADHPPGSGITAWLKEFNDAYRDVEAWVKENYPDKQSRRYPPDSEEQTLQEALSTLDANEKYWDEITSKLTPAERLHYATLFLVARKCRLASQAGQDINNWSQEDWLVLYNARHTLMDSLIPR